MVEIKQEKLELLKPDLQKIVKHIRLDVTGSIFRINVKSETEVSFYAEIKGMHFILKVYHRGFSVNGLRLFLAIDCIRTINNIPTLMLKPFDSGFYEFSRVNLLINYIESFIRNPEFPTLPVTVGQYERNFNSKTT